MLSPLGKGHPVVLYGKQMLENMKKERTRVEFEALENAQVRSAMHSMECDANVQHQM
jgi:hypothetical protein